MTNFVNYKKPFCFFWAGLLFIFLLDSCKTTSHRMDEDGLPIIDLSQKGDLSKNFDGILLKAISEFGPEGATLEIPKGVYQTKGIKIDGAQKRFRKIKIKGSGSSLMLSNQANSDVISIKKIPFVEIENLTINGAKLNQKTGKFSGISINQCKEASVENCMVSNCQRVGILLRSVWKFSVKNNRSFDHGINEESVTADGILIGNSKEGIIEGNFCYGNNSQVKSDGDGIQIVGSQAGHTKYFGKNVLIGKIEIRNNRCYNNGRRGIKIQRSNVLIEENNCYENGTRQISVMNKECVLGVEVLNNKIGSDNTVSVALLKMGGNPNESGCTNGGFSVVGNVFKGKATNHAVDFQNVQGFVFKENTFQMEDPDGLNINIREDCVDGDIELPDSLDKVKMRKNKMKKVDLQKRN